MELGQLPAEGHAAVRAEGGGEIVQRRPKLMGGLMEDHRPLFVLQAFQVGLTILLVHRQKALKGKASRGQAGHSQSVHKGAGPRDRHHGNVLGGALGHQLLPWVADGRGPGVRDQGAALAGQQAVHQFISAGVGVVAVIAHHGFLDAQVVEQLHRHAGVLGGDEVHRLQRLRRPGRKIPQVPNGGGDQIQRPSHGNVLLLCSLCQSIFCLVVGRQDVQPRPALLHRLH